MHDLVGLAGGWLLHYLVRSAVVLIAVAILGWSGERLLRRVGPEAQHRMWVMSLLAGVMLPFIPAAWLSGLPASSGHAALGTASVTYRMIAAASGHWALSPGICTALGAMYILTVLFALTRLMWRWRQTCAMTRRASALEMDTRAERLVEEAARRAGATLPAVRSSAEICGPVVLGWRLPLLLVPEGFFDAPEEDVSAAVAHECAHIARRDYATNLIYEFATTTVAYHPACRLIRRRIAATRELACDEVAAGIRGDRPEYAAALLRLARAMAAPAARMNHAIGVFDGNTLEERVMRLTIDVARVSRWQRMALGMVAACVLLGGGLAATAVPLDVTSQDAAAKQERVYKVGGDVTAPVLVHSVDAEYTKKAKNAKYQGVSVVSCVVDKDGMPQHVHTTRRLGMGLDEKAIEAVRQYQFKPGMLHGKPVAVAITIEVNFHIY